MNSTVEIMGYPVYTKTLDEIEYSQHNLIINTINAYSYVVAKNDKVFTEALIKSDILVPDGFPLVLAGKILKKVRLKKIAGAEVFEFYCKKINAEKGKCLFMGSSEATLRLIRKRIQQEYPDINVEFYSPPYKKVFSQEDNNIMIDVINKFNPDVLFVGMTAPKQEKWVHENNTKFKAKVVCSIGAVFDFYAGTNKRPANFWIKLNLEWFIRLLKEPKRLWKRYLIYSPIFFMDLLKYKFFK
jgi:N-acetylglucosaminyldiphosphoundecaprenol N-acetyl-beta-D-mannosaminyltransferase